MRTRQFVCIHGHFYQPPRENPWLEAIEIQDSAAPFHDWNSRITAECYAPNTAARLLDADGRILEITNNFERISFDIGPTLLSWLEEFEPKIYQAILDADRKSLHNYGGHGNATAQAYNHPILPLCNHRDLTTQVLWGIRDFEARYGHRPEGMWLPECAVNTTTLEEIVAQGITYTILAPHQAARVRRKGSRSWTEIKQGQVDTTRAYQCQLPSGRSIALFFYDGALAQAVAFGGLPKSGEEFLSRILDSFSRRKKASQLVNLATDGETYGHHVPFSEMALAYVLTRLEENPEVSLTNYGHFLEVNPPRYEAEVVENSSWSCYHGIERWRADCGCAIDPGRGWHQRWRLPLREALDELRDDAAALYEREAGSLFKDPWAARDDYIDIILDRSDASLKRFFDRHQAQPIGEAELVRSLKLLEIQRHAMLMYTSCGWFFDEISGIESVKVLEYAAQVIHLAKSFGADWEDSFRRNLEKAPSNIPEFGSGAGVYDQLVKPAVVDLPRVVAHHAISSFFEEPRKNWPIYCYNIHEEDRSSSEAGSARLTVGQMTASSVITRETYKALYGVVYIGGYDFHCSVAPADKIDDYNRLKATLIEQFEQEGLTEVIRTLDNVFGLDYYALQDLFIENRRKVLELLTEQVVTRFDSTFRALFEENRRLMTYLQEANAPLVPGFREAASYTLERELKEILASGEISDHEEIFDDIIEEAKLWGVSIVTEAVTSQFEVLLEEAMDALEEDLSVENLEHPVYLLDKAKLLEVSPRLWPIQNRFWKLSHSRMPELLDHSARNDPGATELLNATVRLGERLNFNRGSLPE